MGSRNSIPASSASCARRMLFSHEFTHRSGTLVTDIPLEQLAEKKPSFSLLSFRIGDCLCPTGTSVFRVLRGPYDTSGPAEVYEREEKRAGNAAGASQFHK